MPVILTLSLNSQTMTAGFYGESSRQVFRLSVRPGLTADDFRLQLNQLARMCDAEDHLRGAIIASVAPRLTQAAAEAAHQLCGVRPYIIGPGLKTGIDIKINDRSQLGADLCAMAAGLAAKYPLPAILVNISEATTLSYIDAHARYLGTVICPGLGASLKSLTDSAELLNPVPLEAPERALGMSSEESVRSGLIYGAAGMLDALIARIRAEHPAETVVATGQSARAVLPHCKEAMQYDEHLLTDGMRHIFLRQPARKG